MTPMWHLVTASDLNVGDRIGMSTPGDDEPSSVSPAIVSVERTEAWVRFVVEGGQSHFCRADTKLLTYEGVGQ